jgi:hypothetical protein
VFSGPSPKLALLFIRINEKKHCHPANIMLSCSVIINVLPKAVCWFTSPQKLLCLLSNLLVEHVGKCFLMFCNPDLLVAVAGV